jgi:hypothetical protein
MPCHAGPESRSVYQTWILPVKPKPIYKPKARGDEKRLQSIASELGTVQTMKGSVMHAKVTGVQEGRALTARAAIAAFHPHIAEPTTDKATRAHL